MRNAAEWLRLLAAFQLGSAGGTEDKTRKVLWITAEQLLKT